MGACVLPEAVRFQSKFERSCECDTLSCWDWKGSVRKDGYGSFGLSYTGKTVLAHRYSYKYFVGPIPPELVIDHLCRNRRCVNPAHLEPVTTRINLLRGETLTAREAALTHCKRGHTFDAVNTYARPGGGRNCRTCDREYHARRYKSLREMIIRATSTKRDVVSV